MVEIEAVTFISDRLADEVMLVDEVLSEISQAPPQIKRYLKQQCKTVEEMEEFLENHGEYFMVENGRVAVYDSLLEAGRLKAVDYFKEELSSYDQRPNCMNFRGHIGQATNDVIDFINCFYPGEEFKAFLEGYPDVFVVFNDDTVDLIEEESVDFFEKCLNDYGDGFFFMNLRGHVAQAPLHVMNYINRSYPGKIFLKFLENNSDVFNVQNGYVYLTPDW